MFLLAIVGLPVVIVVAGGLAMTVLCSDRFASRGIGPDFPEWSYVLVLQNGSPRLVSGSDISSLRQQPAVAFSIPSGDLPAINAALRRIDGTAHPGLEVASKVTLLPSPAGTQRIQTQFWSKNHATYTTYTVRGGLLVPERLKYFGIGQAIQAGVVSMVAASVWLLSCFIMAYRRSAPGA